MVAALWESKPGERVAHGTERDDSIEEPKGGSIQVAYAVVLVAYNL